MNSVKVDWLTENEKPESPGALDAADFLRSGGDGRGVSRKPSLQFGRRRSFSVCK